MFPQEDRYRQEIARDCPVLSFPAIKVESYILTSIREFIPKLVLDMVFSFLEREFEREQDGECDFLQEK